MIYLIEDDDNIRKLVSYALMREGYEVKDFSSSRDFWYEVNLNTPELVLLDIMLPGEDGLTILKRLREKAATADTPVIMLTAKSSEFDKVTGLDMGADDYISKPFGMTELISRVRAVLRRYGKTMAKSEQTYNIGRLYINPSKHIIEIDGREVVLSYKEYYLLMELVKADGRVAERDKLLSKVWGEYYTESRTLDVHIRKLRMKLEGSGVVIQTIKGIGYRLIGENDE